MAKKQPVPENEIHKAALSIRSTPVDEVFAAAAAARPAAVRILAEGDSWFAYPKGGLIFGAPSNVVDQLKSMGGDPDLVIHDLSSNGDEAVAMVCGDSKLDMIKRLASHAYDVLLFSGGGNDIVGIYDFEFFLNEYQSGFLATDCIRVDRFERRLTQIRHAYCDLIELVLDYSRNKAIRIVTHTYDIPVPNPQGAEFLGGLLKIAGARSWMHPYMVTKKIVDPAIQKEIARYMLDRLGSMLKSIAMQPGYSEHFVVVDTHGLVGPNEWRNEIHPTPDGFRKVAQKILNEGIKPLVKDPVALPRVAAARKAAASSSAAPRIQKRIKSARPKARRSRTKK
jgi:hypothetical protein